MSSQATSDVQFNEFHDLLSLDDDLFNLTSPSSAQHRLQHPILRRFGQGKVDKNDELVKAYYNPTRVRELIDQGHTVTSNSILAACYDQNPETLKILLSARPDPDARLVDEQCNRRHLHRNWAATDYSLRMKRDQRKWYPIHFATYNIDDKEVSAAMVRILLQYKVNLFAIYKQPIMRARWTFPGQFKDGLAQRPLRRYWKGKPGSEVDEESDEELGRTDEDPDECSSDSSSDEEKDEWTHKSRFWWAYGLRSVLHSLFEDGAYVRPFLEEPGLRIDWEHRDPQGRTLIHSVCRSALGADAHTNAVFYDLRLPKFNTGLAALDDHKSSLFHILRNRGADLAAVDESGKTILHHLLEAKSGNPYSQRPPLIWNTFKYILKHHTDLINRPDRFGTYPIHTALHRLRSYYVESNVAMTDSPLEPAVDALLDAGADAGVRDSRGNTVLHYLADNGLVEQWRSTMPRALCRRFIFAGVDVNARNHQGETALEMIFEDDGTRTRRLERHNVHFRKKDNLPMSKADSTCEVFAMFDAAGARWASLTSQGQNLLHVAALWPATTGYRVKYLLDKGVNPKRKDRFGDTVKAIAKREKNIDMLQELDTFFHLARTHR